MIEDDGGPAFPWQYWDRTLEGLVVREQGLGMSLRDWFAGQAIVGMLANPQLSALVKLAKEADADAYCFAAMGAYRMADAMLKERKDQTKI